MSKYGDTRGIVIFVPLQEEMRYVYEALKRDGAAFLEEYDPGTDEYTFYLPVGGRETLPVTIHVLGDMGNIRTINRIAPILHVTRPNCVFLVGIAGSFDPNFLIFGDVLISSRVKYLYPDKVKPLDHSSEYFISPGSEADGKIPVDPYCKFSSSSFFRYRADCYQRSHSMKKINEYLTHLKTNGLPESLLSAENHVRSLKSLELPIRPPKVVEACIFGSDMVIDCEHYIDFIKKSNDDVNSFYYRKKAEITQNMDDVREADRRVNWFKSDVAAVDMESYGFFTYIEAMNAINQINMAFAIRGISDLAAKKNKTGGKVIREIAGRNAANVTADFLSFLVSKGIVGLN